MTPQSSVEDGGPDERTGDPERVMKREHAEDQRATVRASAADLADSARATRQYRNNMLWEYTQALLALSLTGATIFASLRYGGVSGAAGVGPGGEVLLLPVPETLKNALFVVIGFYFGRTNHSRPTPREIRNESPESL